MSDLDPRGLAAALHAVEGEGLTSDGGTPHGWRCEHPDRYPDYCKCPTEMAESAITAYLAATQPIVTTAEELVELPVGTVVLDSHQEELVNLPEGWYCIAHNEVALPHEDIALPARVIHRGKE